MSTFETDGAVDLHYSDRESWLETIWEALQEFRDVNIPEGPPHHDEQWNDICTAMAWIAEELGVSNEPDHD